MTIDISQFQNTDIVGANSTAIPLIPVGEYVATIKKVGFATGEKADASGVAKPWVRCEVSYRIDDPQVKAEMATKGVREPSVTQRLFLDLNETGQYDTSEGRNVGIGQLRAACNQNLPNVPWNFNMLEGQTVRVKVTHNTYQGNTSAEIRSLNSVASL